ncbi:MAG: B12-binding domain-containing radical SAM protein [Armatimonadetes bacterium]|nr:B12-binding domain-containing radical SAM protein [Armatimonadota bacterium]
MKIALVAPHLITMDQQKVVMEKMPYVTREDIELVVDSAPTLGLLTVAGMVDTEVHEVKHYEEDWDGLGFLEEDFDLLLLSATNTQSYRAYEIARQARARGVYTAMGGYHASALPEEAKAHVDTVIVGEGEDTFPQFFEDFQKGCPKPFYRSSNRVDPRHSPMPRYELIGNKLPRYERVVLEGSRGCPRHCDYCAITILKGGKLRLKSIDQILGEIEYVRKFHPNAVISFADENMLLHRRHVKDLLREMVGMKVPWECFSDVSIAFDDELLQLCHDSYCMYLMVGLESLSPNSLERQARWKSTKIGEYRQAINNMRSFGLSLCLLFVIGFDDDDADTFKMIADFCAEFPECDGECSVLTPLPGTQFFANLKRDGRLISEDWSRYNWYTANYLPARLTPQELERGFRWLFKQLNTPQHLADKKKYLRDFYQRLYGQDRPPAVALQSAAI